MPVETPTTGRGGLQQNDSLAGGYKVCTAIIDRRMKQLEDEYSEFKGRHPCCAVHAAHMGYPLPKHLRSHPCIVRVLRVQGQATPLQFLTPTRRTAAVAGPYCVIA